MSTVFRRIPLRLVTEMILLVTAMSALVTGLGVIVRGAEKTAFLPTAIPAAFLGWCLGRTRLKPWQALVGLIVFGILFLWGVTAQLGGITLLLAAYTAIFLIQNFFYLQGGPLPVHSNAAALDAAIQSFLAQSSALWGRTEGWIVGLHTGAYINDPVVTILSWSLLLWVLGVWAGWAAGRNKPLIGILPGLAVLAETTQYTNADVIPLWLMTSCLLGLMGLSWFDASIRRWIASRLDYAELIVSDTMFSAVLITLALAILGWVLPMVSVKDILESFRRHDTAQNQTVNSLGLQARQEPFKPSESPYAPERSPGLPNIHLLGSGPELSRQVVFTVSTGELPPIPVMNVQNIVPRHYWRSYSFDVYTGTGWLSSRVESIKTIPGQALFTIPTGYRLLKQNFNLKNGAEGSLYWSGVLYQSNLPFQAGWRTPPGQAIPQAVDPFRGADLYGAVNSSADYQVESLIVQASEAQLRSASREIPDFIQQRYTSLPANVPERVFALARGLTSAAATPYDEAAALETYLRLNYQYSLKVPAPPVNVDVADYFLFDLKKGYCDYYATAMVVMARAVGLPARLVMGYASGTYDPPTAEYIVTAADAHAWVEIYFAGIGWVEFEPTAGLPEIVRTAASGEFSRNEPVTVQQWDKFVRTVYRMPAYVRWVFIALAGMFVWPSLLSPQATSAPLARRAME